MNDELKVGGTPGMGGVSIYLAVYFSQGHNNK